MNEAMSLFHMDSWRNSKNSKWSKNIGKPLLQYFHVVKFVPPSHFQLILPRSPRQRTRGLSERLSKRLSKRLFEGLSEGLCVFHHAPIGYSSLAYSSIITAISRHNLVR